MCGRQTKPWVARGERFGVAVEVSVRSCVYCARVSSNEPSLTGQQPKVWVSRA